MKKLLPALRMSLTLAKGWHVCSYSRAWGRGKQLSPWGWAPRPQGARERCRRCGSSPHSATNLTCGKNQRRFETASTLKVLQVFTGSHASWAAGVEPLCLKVISCLTFGGTGSLCSTPVAPLYIPTSNARGFYFLHSLAKTHFPFFFFLKNYTCLCRCEVIGRF